MKSDDFKIEIINEKIVIKNKEKIILPEDINAEFMVILNDVMKEHGEAFKALIDR